MGKFFYQKLAFSNMKKNSRFEIPYLITGIFTVAAFYMIGALALNPQLEKATGTESVVTVMNFATVIVAIFSSIILFYTDSFLMKRRKKELGLYNILGMEKRHIGITLFFEALYSISVALVGGIILGLLFSKLMFMISAKLIGSGGMKFFFCADSVIHTVELFAAIYFASFIIHLLQLKLNNPIEMLKGGNVGEKEPRAKWFIALLGIGCIGTGYYISITTRNPLQAIELFFIAVLLVIAGTYFLFTAATIALLKILRANKKYYYKANHFTAVSGLMYRMKQNAVGLASICILLTMVLVMVSTTFSLYTGIDGYITKSFVKNSYMYYTDFSDELDEEMQNLISAQASAHDLKIEEIEKYKMLGVSAVIEDGEFRFSTDYFSQLDKICILEFVTAEDYEKYENVKLNLADNEVIVCSEEKLPFDTFSLAGKEWSVKDTLDSFPIIDVNLTVNTYNIIVPSYSDLERIYLANAETHGDNASNIQTRIQFNMVGSEQNQIDAVESVSNSMRDIMKKYTNDGAYSYNISNASSERRESTAFYGGFFFIGIYLGTIFTLGMVLIIYYKQLSEGYDDRERYVIMQKVGMTRREVKKSISSQVLIVFFLPLVTACCHLAAAYPMLERMLRLFNMNDISRYGISTLITVGVFSVIYFAVYKITSKIYYSIVS